MHVSNLEHSVLERLKEKEFHATESLHEIIPRLFQTAFLAYALFGGLLERTFGLSPNVRKFCVLLVIRKAVAIFAGYRTYDATRLYRGPLRQASTLAESRLNGLGYILKRVTFHKSGATFSGAVCTHRKIINNGSWAIHALGVRSAWEQQIEALSQKNYALGLNTLVINGPGIGDSTGYPTRYQIGACFETGLQYLENVIKANRILMYGYSFGGGSLAEGILNHDFSYGQQKNIKYLFVADRTFDHLQHIAGKTVCSLLYPLFAAVGMQLDGVEAAKKLSSLGIRQIIIQGCDESDDVIVDTVALAKAIKQNTSLCNTQILESSEIAHHQTLPLEIKNALDQEILTFLERSTGLEHLLER